MLSKEELEGYCREHYSTVFRFCLSKRRQGTVLCLGEKKTGDGSLS